MYYKTLTYAKRCCTVNGMLTKADIDWLKAEFLPGLADAVEKRLGSKLDAVNTKLDTFIGEISSRREEQTLHEGKHEDLEERVTRIERTLKIPSAS